MPNKRLLKIEIIFYEKWIPFQQYRLNVNDKRKKKVKIKTNNQELLIRKHNESVATSKCIEFQKTSVIRVQDLEVDKDENKSNTKYNLQLKRKSTVYCWSSS